MTKVKLCGITRLDDARLAAEAGAERVVLSLDGPDWMGQAELLAQAAAGLG